MRGLKKNSGIASRCPLRRVSLPVLPCDCTQCSWYVNDISYKNCFSVLSDYLHEYYATYGSPYSFEIEDIAKLEGITEDEVSKIIDGSLGKLRKLLRNEDDYSL